MCAYRELYGTKLLIYSTVMSSTGPRTRLGVSLTCNVKTVAGSPCASKQDTQYSPYLSRPICGDNRNSRQSATLAASSMAYMLPYSGVAKANLLLKRGTLEISQKGKTCQKSPPLSYPLTLPSISGLLLLKTLLLILWSTPLPHVAYSQVARRDSSRVIAWFD